MLTFSWFKNNGFKWWRTFFIKISWRRNLKKKLRIRKIKNVRRWRKKALRIVIRRIIRWGWALRKNDEGRNFILKKKTLNGVIKRLNF